MSTTRVVELQGIDARAAVRPFVVSSDDPTKRRRGGFVARAVLTPAGPGTVALTPIASTVEAEGWGPGAEWLLEQLPRLLGLHDDPSTFEPQHPLVRRLHRDHPGLRIGASGVVWQELLHTIIGQKVTTFEANRSWARLVRAHGEPAPGPFAIRLPPTPARVSALGYADFHPLGVERKRAEAILAAARVAVRLEAAAALEPNEARTRLTTVPGIGPWTADTVVIRCHGDADATLRGDYHLPSVVAWALAGERRGTDERMLELLEPFRPHRWRVVRLLMVGHRGPERRGPRMAPRNIERH